MTNVSIFGSLKKDLTGFTVRILPFHRCLVVRINIMILFLFNVMWSKTLVLSILKTFRKTCFKNILDIRI